MRRSISSTGTGSEKSSYSLQYVHERLHRRMGTICAMYGWPVEASALPIETSSRTLRVAAFQRRRALIWRLGVVVGTEDMVRFQYIEPPLRSCGHTTDCDSKEPHIVNGLSTFVRGLRALESPAESY